MLDRLIPLVPTLDSVTALSVAAVGMVIGLGLWLAGSRVSRSIVTLATVALGGAIGKELPTWCHWSIDPMGTAVGGATLLGLSGYLLHRFWVGVGLALVLCVWATVGIWLASHHRPDWHAPAVSTGLSMTDYGTALRAAVPEPDQKPVALALSAAAAAGLVLAWLWPRMGAVWLYSLVGGSVLLGAVLATVRTKQPDWITRLPQQNWAQLGSLAAVILLGVAVQWWQAPKRSLGVSPAHPSTNTPDDDWGD